MSNLATNRKTTTQHSPTSFIARWLFVAITLLLAACSQQQNANVPRSTTAVAVVSSPASVSTSVQAAQPTAAMAATVPAVQPTAAAQSAPSGKVLYACTEGLCSSSLNGADARTIVPFSSKTIALDGYAFSRDGSKIVYVLRSLEGKPKELKAANMYLANADGSESKPLFSIQGKADDNGVSGVGVLGLSADNNQVIFIERGQVFTSALDGANRKQIIKSLGSSQAGTPIVSLSPQGTSLLVVQPDSANNVTLYNLADGSQRSYDLDFSMRAETFGSDDKHIVAVRYDPPFDPKTATQTAIERKVLGYAEVNTDNGMSRSIGDTSADWSASVISNAVGGHVVLADKANTLALLDLSNGQHTPVTLPQYSSGARIVLFAATS